MRRQACGNADCCTGNVGGIGSLAGAAEASAVRGRLRRFYNGIEGMVFWSEEVVTASVHHKYAPRETKKLPERGPQKRKQENPFWAKRMAEEARHANKIDADRSVSAQQTVRQKKLARVARSKKSKGSKNRALDNRPGKSSADTGMNTTDLLSIERKPGGRYGQTLALEKAAEPKIMGLMLRRDNTNFVIDICCCWTGGRVTSPLDTQSEGIMIEQGTYSTLIRSQQEARTAYLSPVGATRTVASLTREDQCFEQYSELLEGLFKTSNRTTFWSNMLYSPSQAMSLFVIALSFRYSSRFISNLNLKFSICGFFVGLMSNILSGGRMRARRSSGCLCEIKHVCLKGQI
ncbi:hypothetical protein FIBSPDRAFT_897225 [Athelia psychrophila]|uniref:ABC transmembrane type-1 domain-containing protein n=1 Tax=Athelia psychrophila TaxID=1759441 RepID=A0A166CI43_9AGAM|nr:hypothetical protein FIBSPDRAFT_897225 [Fibularhizoctonia sp. CBS 109695]